MHNKHKAVAAISERSEWMELLKVLGFAPTNEW